MEILLLLGIAAALALTVLVVFVKLLVFLLLVPLKLVGAVLGCAGSILLLPLKIVGVLAFVAVALLVVLALPIAIPLVLFGGFVLALAC